jgi:hypothetical protein
VLYRKNLNLRITLSGCMPDGRAVAIIVNCGNLKLLCFGLYLPCDDRSPDYLHTLSNIFGFVESVKEANPGCSCIVTGDFNFICEHSNRGFREFSSVADDLDLVVCDDLDVDNVGYTYFHESLGHKSLIDHVFVSASLRAQVTEYRIRNDAINLSDHLPVQFNISLPCEVRTTNLLKSNTVKEFRWDKGDLHKYYLQSGDLLGRIRHSWDCVNVDGHCNDPQCCLNIDIYYNEIVHCLVQAAAMHIPKIPASALKHYWSVALDDLKQSSIQAHTLWIGAGKPASGDIFELKKNAKYKYKLAIRDAALQFEGRFDDDLLASYFNKDFNNFWKTWKRKNGAKCISIQQVDGLYDNQSIANKFAEHFSTVSNESDCVSINNPVIASVYNVQEWFFNIEDIDCAIRALKLGKAAGDDNIAPEHLVYAHPSVISHLKNLFNVILSHSHVPSIFGSGIIVPILKDRIADVSKLDNYRGITLCNVISKIFEICLYNKFESYLSSHHLQHGFKKHTGCQDAVFIAQQVANYFTSRGSAVYISSLDASKAFDRVSHSKLMVKLLDRNMPLCFIHVINDWYGKLSSVVRWNGILSSRFPLALGVRQGSTLSPVLFNIYVDDLLQQLEISDLGCHVGSYYYGCIMYADDLLLLSASVGGLQLMLDMCASYGVNNNILFNYKKSVCLKVGKFPSEEISRLYLGDMELNWVNSIKYLGVMLTDGPVLSVDTRYMKRRFYASCNSVLNRCKSVNEDVKLHLVKSFCLPMLTYCIAALDIKKSDVRDLAICWNDAFRKIFHYHRWESVKELQFYSGELPFDMLYDLSRWKFFSGTEHTHRSTALLIDIAGLQYKTVVSLKSKYGDINSINQAKCAIYDHLRTILNT